MLLRGLPSLATRALRTTTITSSRSLSTNLARRAATAAKDSHGEHHDDHGHESHYDPPGGWLWGVRPGEKREKEGWEGMFYAMCLAYVVAIFAVGMKEDTSIQTWALEEARRRLEKEGILEDPNPNSES